VTEEQAQITRSDIIARVRRFAVLRAAQRALSPSVRSPETLPALAPLRTLRNQLQALMAAVESRDKGEAADATLDTFEADMALDGYARQLRLVADGVQLPQLRASLPELAKEQRDEVVALLDLLLEEDEGLDSRMSVIDYLITLLCVVRQGESWSMVVDPPNVSEGTRARSLGAPPCDPERQNEIFSRFLNAAEQLKAGGNADSVLGEMRQYKADIGPYFFAPEIMRCLVSYNMAVRSYREAQISAVRAMDREVDLDPIAAEPVPETDTPSAAPEPPPKSLGADGMAAIEAAIRQRIAGQQPAAGTAGEIANLIDIAGLPPEVTEAFQSDGTSNVQILIRRIAVLGLVAEKHAELETQRVALGIGDGFFEEQLLEVSERVRRETNDLIANNGYDHARTLSDLQSRYLFNPLVKARQSQAPEKRKKSSSPATSVDSGDLARIADRMAQPRGRRPGTRKRVKQRGQMLRWTLATVALGLCAALANQVAPSPKSIGEMTPDQLRNVSSLLVQGYRNQSGKGPVFIGTLASHWEEMKRWQRKQGAEAIHKRLGLVGVRELMLFDERRKLQIHYVGDKNKYPDWDKPQRQKKIMRTFRRKS